MDAPAALLWQKRRRTLASDPDSKRLGSGCVRLAAVSRRGLVRTKVDHLKFWINIKSAPPLTSLL